MPTENISETAAQRAERSNAHMENARSAARSGREHLREAGSHVGEGVRNARAETRAAMDDFKTAASETSQAASDRGAIYLERAGDMIRERPLTAFGIAFATGWLVSRVFRAR